VQGDQGQRDEHQAKPERAHELRAEQMARVAGVLGQWALTRRSSRLTLAKLCPR
jgi:hypothetical protein